MSNDTPDMNNLRQSISDLDAQILNLLASRKNMSRDVAKSKKSSTTKVRDQDYEKMLLSQHIQKGEAMGLDAHYVVELFNTIIQDSVRTQHDELQADANPQLAADINRVSFLGDQGSYSHQAVQKYFARRKGKLQETGCSSFKQVVEMVENEQADYGILPLENSTSGSINDVYDIMQYTSLSIVGEIVQPIEHCLLTAHPDVKAEDIKTIYVHPQVYAQCSLYLAGMSNVAVEYVDSTSTAMQRVEEDNNHSSAAIGGLGGYMKYNLHVTESDLANQKENHTRFIVLARKPQDVALNVPAKTSLIFSCRHKAGALVDALVILKNNGLNLLKLESRPVPGNQWEEMFYIDISANIADEDVAATLEELRQSARYMKVLGCYPDEGIGHTEPDYAELNAKKATAKKAAKKDSAQAKAKVPAKPKSYKLVSRDSQVEDTIIELGNAKIGGDSFVTIAGPCAVESEEQIMDCARAVKEHGGGLLRGGCFKPRTNPYSFQGLGYEGLDIMEKAGKKHRLPIVTEVMSAEDVVPVAKQSDMIQIGARNMQNFTLLKAAGKINRPVFLKRGLMSSLDELLNAAEYIMAGGNKEVILCERGIRTFETATRNTLDLSAVPILKQLTHLPIMIDPSHAVGRRDLVAPMAKAAKAVGAHGIMVEIHPNPEVAKSDGPQSLYFDQFSDLMAELYGE